MLAKSIANKYHQHNLFIPFDDLYQEAVLGLYDAARRYDPERGTVFTTVAYWHIRNYVLKYVQSNIISGPRPTNIEVQNYLYNRDMSVDDFNHFADTFINPHCIEGYAEGIIDTQLEQADIDADYIEEIISRVKRIKDNKSQALCLEGIRLILAGEPQPFKQLSEIMSMGIKETEVEFVRIINGLLNE